MAMLQQHNEILIPVEGTELRGELAIPHQPSGAVLFAHGSGSSRHSPRNQFVAETLRAHGMATLLFDLLTEQEEEQDRFTGHLRFDIDWLAGRLIGATRWFQQEHPSVAMGYFGSSTGGGAALLANAQSDIPIKAIVSRGGRPDLAGAALAEVTAATLLIVGGDDAPVITLNQKALAQMRCRKELRIVPGATHLFEEPGALEQVSTMAAEWFARHFRSA
jgi:dienelactone hydrolase